MSGEDRQGRWAAMFIASAIVVILTALYVFLRIPIGEPSMPPPATPPAVAPR